MITLSICIPTYNRGKVIFDLVNRLLTIKSKDIEIVVTNTASTDQTAELLATITDARLRVISTNVRVPAASNMMEVLFQAQGKYAIFCNDRDYLIPDGIDKLLEYLRQHDEFAVIHTSGQIDNSDQILSYNKGIDSLSRIKYTGHPTGMVFNRRMMQALKKENYLPENHNNALLYTLYPHCCLAWDLVKIGQLGIMRLYCWNECNQNFKIQNKSGIGVNNWAYYLPKTTERLLIETVDELLLPEHMNDDDLTKFTLSLLIFYYKRCLIYKSIASSHYEPIHYGLKRKFVTTAELMKVCVHFFQVCKKMIEDKGLPSRAFSEFRKKYTIVDVLQYSIKTDFLIMKREIRWQIKKIF